MSTMLSIRHHHLPRVTQKSPTTSTQLPPIIGFISKSKPNPRIRATNSVKLKLESLKESHKPLENAAASKGSSRAVIIGAVSLSLALFLMGLDDHHGRALALGPEGPLLEEFWDNMRRYGLYVLTVSTGALYTLLLPIVELLKNPISAILILVIIGGGFFIVSQIVSAMVGLSDFSYDYSY